MKQTNILKMLLLSVLCVTVAAVSLITSGCGNKEKDENKSKKYDTSVVSMASDTTADDPKVIGEGEKSFALTVTDIEGNQSFFTVKTDKKTVGEALQELNFIDGEESEYGLYVKAVNGIVADFDADKTYWAFYVDGQYANAGIDQTEIEDGKQYELKVQN